MKSILGCFITSAWARQPGTELSPHQWSSDTSILLDRLSGCLHIKEHFLIHKFSTRYLCPFHLPWHLHQQDGSPHKFPCWICCLHQEDRDPVGSFLLCVGREVKQQSRLCHLDTSTWINQQALCIVQLCQTALTLQDSPYTMCAPARLKVRKAKGFRQNCAENLYW